MAQFLGIASGSVAELETQFELAARLGYIKFEAAVFDQITRVARLADPSLFAQVFVEHGAVMWPGEIDLAPDAMHAEIKKKAIWVL